MTNRLQPLIGAICDDVTGATDIASMFVRGGMQVVQYVGLPEAEQAVPNADALVIALKSRSIPANEAIAQSITASRRLIDLGVRQIYFKYCSTFDSTPEGNIGPVAEALREELGAAWVPHLPSLPVNGRTVYQGHLFVHDRLLSETGMAKHPLNPMNDSDLVRVLQAQTSGRVGKVTTSVVAQGAGLVTEVLNATDFSHVIGDAISEDDLEIWAETLRDAPLVAGGSGLAQPLARAQLAASPSRRISQQQIWPVGPALILAGSCSAMTLAQVADYRARGGACLQLDIAGLIKNPAATVANVLGWIAGQSGAAPLIYSSASPDEIGTAISGQNGKIAALIEDGFAEIARLAVSGGLVQRLIVAGGETSGSVVRGIGASALRIGLEIAPGVPWTEALDKSGASLCALALKSGNFGAEDFFVHALSDRMPA